MASPALLKTRRCSANQTMGRLRTESAGRLCAQATNEGSARQSEPQYMNTIANPRKTIVARSAVTPCRQARWAGGTGGLAGGAEPIGARSAHGGDDSKNRASAIAMRINGPVTSADA